MAVISRGQITIMDLNDGKSINLYLGSNVATTQIFNEKFMPDFSSIAPSSMVLAPIAPLLSCEMNVCLQCSRLNL